MGIMILGPLNQNSSVATDELHRLFADPRRAFKQQSALLNFDEFLAVAITRARALGANIDNIPGDARPVEQINRWIVYPDGVVTPVIGCTYTDDSVWVFNPDNPLRVTKLDRNDCGIRWWVSFGGNHRQALANQASAKARDLCRTVKNGRNPNNALRAARA